MVNVLSTRRELVDTYTKLASYVGIATDSPGDSESPSHEASGSDYSRVELSWDDTDDDGSAETKAETLRVPSGTYRYVILAKSSSGDDMVDNVSISTVTLDSDDNKLPVTCKYDQT